jgi:hypothetical protein
MPTLAQATSTASRSYQRVARLALGTALALVALATIASPFNSLHQTIAISRWTVNIATGVAAVAFVLALLVRLYRTLRRPERMWYESRSITEQAKSLAWAYAMGGAPFVEVAPSTGTESGATAPSAASAASDQYGKAIEGLIEEAAARHVPLNRPKSAASVQDITGWMAATRSKPLSERTRIYCEQRVGDQHRYYEKRTDGYRRIARRWNLGLGLLEVVGAVAAGLKALNLVQFDLIGIAGTLAAGGTAWLQFNQFTTLSSIYSAMDFKLAIYERRCRETAWTEPAWAAFVREVEDLLSQEHSSWRQTVQIPQPGTGGLLG